MKSLINEYLKKYYNSHGQTMTWKHMIEVEVDERGNHTMQQIQQWQKKYGIKDTDKCIWVTKNKRDVQRYTKYTRYTPFEFDRNQGFIIPESDDGDNGFLFILK